MKYRALLTCAISLLLIGYAVKAIENVERIRISRILPYDKGVPGQILEMHVEGLGDVDRNRLLSASAFRISIDQDGVKQPASARTVLPTLKRETKADGTAGEFVRIQSVTFGVPQGLHPGQVELRVSYGDQTSEPVALTILERPLRPVIASLPIITVGPPNQLNAPKAPVGDMGWRFERDSKAELRVSPLIDPDVPGSAILVRFKQAGAWFDADAKVIHRSTTTEQFEGGFRVLPARDSLEISVPAGLSMGPADLEVKERANGQEGDAILLKVQIVDSTRAAEAPAENAPRILSVTPSRIGAGQTVMLAVDYLRTLNPDPSQAMIMIEQGTSRYVVKPDQNSVNHMPNWSPDSPVLLMTHATRQIIGPAKIRVFNALRGEQGGLSEPKPLEILDEVLPPEVTRVAESNDADLAPLRQMYEMRQRAGRDFPEYDPQRSYFTVRGNSFDPNPNLIRITLEQSNRKHTLAYPDFSFFGGNFLILRLPKGLGAGPVSVTLEHRGLDSFSTPTKVTLSLTKPT